jgi:hypothetical protein
MYDNLLLHHLLLNYHHLLHLQLLLKQLQLLVLDLDNYMFLML